MSNKKLCSFRLSETTVDYLQAIADENGLSITSALEKIAVEHKQYYNGLIESISDRVIEKYNSKYEDIFTRLRLGTNATDKNAQIILEVLNSIVYYTHDSEAVSTDILKTDIVAGSETTVKKRIEAFKIKNLEAKQKKANRQRLGVF